MDPEDQSLLIVNPDLGVRPSGTAIRTSATIFFFKSDEKTHRRTLTSDPARSTTPVSSPAPVNHTGVENSSSSAGEDDQCIYRCRLLQVRRENPLVAVAAHRCLLWIRRDPLPANPQIDTGKQKKKTEPSKRARIESQQIIFLPPLRSSTERERAGNSGRRRCPGEADGESHPDLHSTLKLGFSNHPLLHDMIRTDFTDFTGFSDSAREL
ncbi:hypothetical protein ACLOJK_026815 [Asimina triloba]